MTSLERAILESVDPSILAEKITEIDSAILASELAKEIVMMSEKSKGYSSSRSLVAQILKDAKEAAVKRVEAEVYEAIRGA